MPALKHKGVVITEVAAICAYLADEFPKAGLNIPVGDPRRGVYLQWLFFGPSCMEPAITDRAFPRKEPPRAGAIGYRDIEALADIVAQAVAKGPYIMGEQFTAADVVIGSAVRWGTMFKLIPERDAFKPYAERIAARPRCSAPRPRTRRWRRNPKLALLRSLNEPQAALPSPRRRPGLRPAFVSAPGCEARAHKAPSDTGPSNLRRKIGHNTATMARIMACLRSGDGVP